MELFYYTSTDTMKYVLTLGNIYATNIRYMNDSDEYINGLQELYDLSKNKTLVEKWIKNSRFDKSMSREIDKVFSEENLKENMNKMEYYSISFCEKNDLLSQWAIYAKESGVSIKMNFNENSYKFFTKSTDKKEKNKAEWNILPQKVYYFTYTSMKSVSKNKYEEVAYKILNQLYDPSSKDHAEWKKERWRYVSTLVKRYDFYQEQEYRLVFEPNESAYQPCVQYRHDKKVLKPYLDIKCDCGWPVWEIMIGPGFNQQVVYDSIEHFLNHAEVKVNIKTTMDYAERIKKYLKPAETALKDFRDYQELNSQVSKRDWLENTELEEAKIFLNQKMRTISKEVCENNTYGEDIKKYFNMHHFTRSGVVLTKSSIPYIF